MTQTEWENEMCIKILDLIENELYIDFRYLDVAISTLILTPKESLRSTATDGISLFFPPEQILRAFRSNPLFLNRAVLHSVSSYFPGICGFVETVILIYGTFPRHCCGMDYRFL